PHEDREVCRSPRRMANFVAHYCGGDGHYADVECAYSELERYIVLSCKARYWKEEGHSLVALVIHAVRKNYRLLFSRTRLDNPARKFPSRWCCLTHFALGGRLRTSNCSA